jgi:hypothetical protein
VADRDRGAAAGIRPRRHRPLATPHTASRSKIGDRTGAVSRWG